MADAYKVREKSIVYNRYAQKWTVGRRYEFEYPQMADVFVHCWRNYGPQVAEAVAKNLKDKLNMTVAKYAKQAAISEAKDAVKDFLLGKIGAPSLPGPAGLALKVLEAAGTVLGQSYLKAKIEMNKNFKNYACDFSPKDNTDEYCNFVLYSWIIDPVNGPYYTTYPPGSIH